MATKNSKKIRSAVDKVVKDTVNELLSRQGLTILGKEAAEIVRRRTRLGFGVAENGGIRMPLKPLTPFTKSLRRRKPLSPKTRPSKSNLTDTAQMLDSLRPFIESSNLVVIKPFGTRREGDTNQRIADKVTREGRPFLNLSGNEIRQLEQFLQSRLETIVKKKLTNLK